MTRRLGIGFKSSDNVRMGGRKKNFISNSAKSKLKDRIIELVSKSQELKFLVGFFYFSGIRELHEGLKGKKRPKKNGWVLLPIKQKGAP